MVGRGRAGRATRRASSALFLAVRWVLLALIYAYRGAIAPQLAGACRFDPSCSRYAEEAIARFGPWHGARLAVGRLARCHPFHDGGWDPVPEALPLRPPGRGRVVRG